MTKRRDAPATGRNREAILQALTPALSAFNSGTVLEIASGTGQHCAFLGGALPHLDWQPSDYEADNFASIDEWTEDLANVRPAIQIDASLPPATWPLAKDDKAALCAIMAINMIHISPWAACTGLLAGAGECLPRGGLLYLYGPYRKDGQHTAPSNVEFDKWLKNQNPEWGVRDMEAVVDLAGQNCLTLTETIPMPANNFSLLFNKT